MQDQGHYLSSLTKTRLNSGRAISIFDIVWLLVTTLSIGLFAFGWPLRYEELTRPTAEIALGLQKAGLATSVWAAGMLGAETLLMLGCTIVGVLLYFQRRKDFVIFVMSLMLITFGTGILNVLDAVTIAYPQLEIIIRLQKAILWLLLLLGFYLFPTGKFFTGWSRWSYAGWVVLTLIWFFFPQSPHNPTKFGAFAADWVFLTYFAWLGSGVVVLVLRMLKSPSQEQRQQTKWVISGLVGAVFIAFLEELPSAINHTLVDHSTPEGVVYALISTIIFVVGALLVPVGIAFSIQREHLWQIDYLISRGVVYGIMVILVILSMSGIFFGLSRLFQAITIARFEWFAVLISAIIVIFMYGPVVRWLQNWIDKKFYGIQISYKQPIRNLSPDQVTEINWVNRTIGRYQINEFLRSGKFGQVYKGVETSSGQPVAVKFLHQYLAALPEHRKAFVAEAKILSEFDHQNLSKLLDYGEDGERTCYMVMEYLPGDTLAARLKEAGCLPIEQANYILGQLANALDYAHNQGVIHLDIKPANILLKKNLASPFGYLPVLTDFGISRRVNQPNSQLSGEVTGTYDYISPEQIHSPDQLDGRADIYSLGVVMYQMVTGRLPFNSNHAAAMLIAHINQPPPNPLLINPEISERTAFAILQAMAKDPSQRFEHAGLFAKALN